MYLPQTIQSLFYKQTKIFDKLNPIVELVIPIRIPSKKTKAKIEIHPVITKAKIRKGSI